LMRDDGIKETFGLGWLASLAGNVTDAIGIVGESGGRSTNEFRGHVGVAFGLGRR
jgi:hypothetical protein